MVDVGLVQQRMDMVTAKVRDVRGRREEGGKGCTNIQWIDFSSCH